MGVQWLIWLHWRGHAAAYSHGARDPEVLESGVEQLFRVLQRELRRRAFGELLASLHSRQGLVIASYAIVLAWLWQRCRCKELVAGFSTVCVRPPNSQPLASTVGAMTI